MNNVETVLVIVPADCAAVMRCRQGISLFASSSDLTSQHAASERLLDQPVIAGRIRHCSPIRVQKYCMIL
jgi:hypothetical protein